MGEKTYNTLHKEYVSNALTNANIKTLKRNMRLIKEKQIYVGEKFVGLIKTDRTYVTIRNKNHFFRKYNGFGISSSVLSELRRYDVKLIKIIYNKIDGTDELYIVTIDDFYNNSLYYKDKGLDYQRILPLNKFKKITSTT